MGVETSDFCLSFHYGGGNSVNFTLKSTILVAKKGFSSKLRCVQRTHKVNLACIAEQLESDNISIEYEDGHAISRYFHKSTDHAIRLLGIRVDLPEKLEDVLESISAKAAA